MDSAPAPSTLLRGGEVLADPFVRELLALRLIAVLGTIGRDGVPHLTPVWFADGGDAVLVATSGSSQKLRNLERDPRASLVLHDSGPGCDVRGVSIEGSAERVPGPETAAAVDRVHLRYVDARGLELPEVAGFLAGDDVALRLMPERAWTWDQRSTPAAAALRAAGLGLPLD